MALLKYPTLKRCDTTNTCLECLPDASGPLAITMSSGSITAANSSVAKVLEKQQKQAGRSRVVNTEYIRNTIDSIDYAIYGNTLPEYIRSYMV